MPEFVSEVDPASFPEPFASLYQRHLQHLQLKGLRPKTIEAYARAMRRIGTHFGIAVTALTADQLIDYFTHAACLALRLWWRHGDLAAAHAARAHAAVRCTADCAAR